MSSFQPRHALLRIHLGCPLLHPWLSSGSLPCHPLFDKELLGMFVLGDSPVFFKFSQKLIDLGLATFSQQINVLILRLCAHKSLSSVCIQLGGTEGGSTHRRELEREHHLKMLFEHRNHLR